MRAPRSRTAPLRGGASPDARSARRERDATETRPPREERTREETGTRAPRSRTAPTRAKPSSDARPARQDRGAPGARIPRGDSTAAPAPTKRPPRVPSVKAERPRPASTPHSASEYTPREGQRIAKLLARAGIASRRDIERMIAEGRIARDGLIVETPATLLTSLRGIMVDGNPVSEPSAPRLFLFHKPAGYLTAARDPRGRPTIYDRLPAELPRVMPVGRLDLSTEGLLLLTNDGGLKRQLELPATGVERSYRARAYGEVSQAQLEELVLGVEIEGMRYGRIDANLERRTGRNQWIEMTLTEGKNREVRRVLEYLGLEVSRLIRTRYGPFVLGDSTPGEVVEVKQHDLVQFRKTLKKTGGA